MSEPAASLTGGCMCGKVRFHLDRAPERISACHCDMCRRWCGGPLLAIHDLGPVHFDDETEIVCYRSSEWAERGFCRICGSNLFYRLVGSGEIMLAAGTLDDQSGLKLESQVFIDEKPDCYAFANETRMMTGAELFALYAPKEEEKE